jgi:hypothetical protein
MHPKEFKKTKNGTGRMTHLSLPNSEIFITKKNIINYKNYNKSKIIVNYEKNN